MMADMSKDYQDLLDHNIQLERVAKDMLFLAEGLADDDSWYGCRRQACKRTAKARKELGLPLTEDFDPDCKECGE
jgi:hypothetical protein